MKKLSTYLFLILFSFQTPSWADDIRDFQIEGMSVGDSLLDYFSEEEIKNHKQSEHLQFPNKKFTIAFWKTTSLKVYEAFRVSYKTSGKNYIIHEITGAFYYKDNFKDCFDKKDKITKEFYQIFKNSITNEGEEVHQFDKTGNSKTKAINYWFDSGDLITLICTDWSNEITKTNEWSDNLSLEIKSKEYNDFLQEAYK